MPPSTAADSDAIVAAASPSAAVKNKGYKLRPHHVIFSVGFSLILDIDYKIDCT